MQGLISSGMRAEGGARSAPRQNADRQPMQQGGNRQPMQQGADRRQREDGVNVNPENAQQQRNVLVNSMLGQLYGPQLDSAARILRQSADKPEEAIGRIVSGLIGAAYKAVKDDGRQVPPGVLFQAGMIASQAVGEMADRMGILNEQQDAEVIESGFMVGLGRFGRANAQNMSDQERQRYAELIDGLEESKRMALAEGDMARQAGTMNRGGA